MASGDRVALPWTVRLSAAAAVGVVLLTAVLWLWSTSRLGDMMDRVERSYEARHRLHRTLELALDAETGQRGYLLTGDRRYLTPFARARRGITEQMSAVRQLTAGDPTASALYRDLETHVTAKFHEMRASLRVYAHEGPTAARETIKTDEGRREMDAIRDIVGRMQEHGNTIVRRRSDLMRGILASANAAMSGALALGLLVTGLLVAIVRRNLRERARRDDERDTLLAETQHAQADAEAANRAKDAFLATLSHELRTPLTPILTWSRLLKQAVLDDAQRTKALDTIERCAKTQAQLVGDLLDVSRIVSGKLRLEVRPVDLGPVIQAAIDVVRPGAEAKGIRVQTVLDSEAGPVSGDPQRLQQVVWNLVSNAVKFTPKGGRVQVSLERVNSHIEIAVSDTGQGIRPEFLPYVFERFQQQDRSASRVHGGLGLGLAIVRHLVELHGGTVHAESPGGDRGAVFTVKLPLIPVRRAAGELVRRHPGGSVLAEGVLPRLDGLQLALIDDDVESNEVVRTLLVSCGAEVRAAASAAEGRAMLDGWRPDVLISDIGMPGEDGMAFIATLRNGEREPRLPAIALTAFAGVDDRVRILSAGFDMHVAKPVDPLELITVVGSLARASGRRSA